MQQTQTKNQTQGSIETDPFNLGPVLKGAPNLHTEMLSSTNALIPRQDLVHARVVSSAQEVVIVKLLTVECAK